MLSIDRKYLFLFDRWSSYSRMVDGSLYFLYSCAADDDRKLKFMADCIAKNILSKTCNDKDAPDGLSEEIFNELKNLDSSEIDAEFLKVLETFGLILVSSFEDLPVINGKY